MSSDARTQANRANAQLSTGPVTAEGKQRSAANSLKHGLNSKEVVILPGEQPEFDSLRDTLFEEIEPQGILEQEAVNQLLYNRWNMRRVQRLEADLVTTASGQDPLANPETAKQANLYQRYHRRFENGYARALRQVKDLQTNRGFRDYCNQTEEIQGPLADLGRIQKFAERSQKSRYIPIKAELMKANLILKKSQIAAQGMLEPDAARSSSSR